MNENLEKRFTLRISKELFKSVEKLADELKISKSKFISMAIHKYVLDNNCIQEVNLPLSTVYCATQHFIAAHKSACTEQPVDFGAVCAGCKHFNECKGNWIETMTPMFDFTEIYPTAIQEN